MMGDDIPHDKKSYGGAVGAQTINLTAVGGGGKFDKNKHGGAVPAAWWEMERGKREGRMLKERWDEDN